MEQFISSTQINSLLIPNLTSDRESLVSRIKNQHQIILNKLLPEIDMHFAVITEQKNSLITTIRSAHLGFNKFSELLKDHIYMEEHIVFPELALAENQMIAAIRDFVINHDDFEAMIYELLSDVRMTLQPLQELMPFRILLLKMERLQLLLSEHNALEDLLFSDFFLEECF